MEIALLCGKKGDLSAAVFARFKNLAQYLGRCFITNHYWPHGFCVCWRNGIGFLAQRRKNAIKHKVICLRMIRIPNNVCSPGFLRRGGAEIADLVLFNANRSIRHQINRMNMWTLTKQLREHNPDSCLMNPLNFAVTHIGQTSWSNDVDREFHPSEA